jgi:hypothetical protein
VAIDYWAKALAHNCLELCRCRPNHRGSRMICTQCGDNRERSLLESAPWYGQPCTVEVHGLAPLLWGRVPDGLSEPQHPRHGIIGVDHRNELQTGTTSDSRHIFPGRRTRRPGKGHSASCTVVASANHLIYARCLRDGAPQPRRSSRAFTGDGGDLGNAVGHPVEIRNAVQQLVEVRATLVETVQQRRDVIVRRVGRRGNRSIS